MNIAEMTIEELRSRAAEIRTAVDAPDADLKMLDEEATEISKRIAEFEAEAQRKAVAAKVAAGEGTTIRVFEDNQEERKMFAIESHEYRNAWLKNLQGATLSADEMRAFTQANGAISTITANAIMSVVRDHAPLLERMTVIYSPVNLTYYVEGTTDEAADHTENATITAANDTLTKITLVPAEIVKLIQVSEAARVMSVDAFEAWLARTLGEAIARKINKDIIEAVSTAATSAGTTITAQTVQTLLGSVKGEGVAIICNRKTLYTGLLPLQDNSKSSIVRFEGTYNTARVYGVDILVDDNVADNTVLAGDLTKVIAAMAEDVTVRQAYDINTNSYKYLGVALFDTKVGLASAFAKLAAE